MSEEIKSIMRYWNLYITHPAERNGKVYNANRAIGVLASTLQEAIQRVLEQHPEATLWSVSHRGEVHLPQVITFQEYAPESAQNYQTVAPGLKSN